jgi:hypothetical protein
MIHDAFLPVVVQKEKHTEHELYGGEHRAHDTRRGVGKFPKAMATLCALHESQSLGAHVLVKDLHSIGQGV